MLLISLSSVYKINLDINSDSCINLCEKITKSTAVESTDVEVEVENTQNLSCDKGQIKLMPEGTCIDKDKCTLDIYVLNEDETECGLCSYFFPESKKYKFMNSLRCISYIPNNTEFNDANLYIFSLGNLNK